MTTLREKLDALPDRHSREDIFRMIGDLQTDLEGTPDLSFAQKVQAHAEKHQELYISYPMLYRTVCKGSYRPHVVEVLLDARDSMESGAATKEEALEKTIQRSVDEVNAIRRSGVSEKSKKE